nr:hypothetical protein CFP56_27875 [Quercus suber]
MKNSGKLFNDRKFSSSKGDRKEFTRKERKKSQSSSDIVCFECNGHGHFKKECPNYLKTKGKVYAITLSDADSSNSDSEDGCDGEGNYSAFMTIAHVETLDELGTLVKELGEHSDLESMGIVEESEDEEVGEMVGLQETYNSLLEKTGEYAKVANAAIKKMKRAEEDYKSLLARYKEAKCEIETLNGELSEAYTKVRFLEQEVVQSHAKVDRISSRKLDDVISSQKHASDKSGLGYTGGSSSSAKVTKEVKFVKTNETAVDKPTPEKVEVKKKQNVANQREFNKSRNQSEVRFGARGRSLPRQQQGPRINYICHYCGLQGHTRPNCQKLRADNNANVSRSRGRRSVLRSWGGEQSRSQNHDPGMADVMKMIGAFTTCLESFNRRFESPNTRTQSIKDITPNARDVWVTKGTHA